MLVRRLTLPLYCYAHEWATLGLFLGLFISSHSVGLQDRTVPWEQSQAPSLRLLPKFQKPKSLRQEAAFVTLSRAYKMIVVTQGHLQPFYILESEALGIAQRSCRPTSYQILRSFQYQRTHYFSLNVPYWSLWAHTGPFISDHIPGSIPSTN